jgi:hypothetical protein
MHTCVDIALRLMLPVMKLFLNKLTTHNLEIDEMNSEMVTVVLDGEGTVSCF